MQGSARSPGMEPARTRAARSSWGGDRASARSRHKRAAARHSPGYSTGIRSRRRRVHRRERRRPRSAVTKAAPKKQLGLGTNSAGENPILSMRGVGPVHGDEKRDERTRGLIHVIVVRLIHISSYFRASNLIAIKIARSSCIDEKPQRSAFQRFIQSDLLKIKDQIESKYSGCGFQQVH
jgi:hypothetical protein